MTPTLWRGSQRDYVDIEAATYTNATLTGSTNETQLYSYTLPGGKMGSNGMLLYGVMWSRTGSNSSLTIKVKFGSGVLKTVSVAAGVRCGSLQGLVANRNSEVQQIGTNSGQLGLDYDVAGAQLTGSVDTSSDVTIQVTCQLGSAADAFILNAVWLMLVR